MARNSTRLSFLTRDMTRFRCDTSCSKSWHYFGFRGLMDQGIMGTSWFTQKIIAMVDMQEFKSDAKCGSPLFNPIKVMLCLWKRHQTQELICGGITQLCLLLAVVKNTPGVQVICPVVSNNPLSTDSQTVQMWQHLVVCRTISHPVPDNVHLLSTEVHLTLKNTLFHTTFKPIKLWPHISEGCMWLGGD